MKLGERDNILLLALCTAFLYSVFAGIGVTSLSYDYTAITECLSKPEKPQYEGGIIINPEFNDGLNGWSNLGYANLEHKEIHGNKFVIAKSRTRPGDSVFQKLLLKRNNIYTFSAWIRVSSGNKVTVTSTFNTPSGIKHGGSVLAEPDCWSFLKGGLNVDTSGPAQLFFQSNDTSVDIWVDSVSLQPFTQNQWKAHQQHSIQKVRKSKVKIKVADSKGRVLPNATISFYQKKPAFPFGSVVNDNLLKNPAYRNWFLSRGFTVTTFENEMKWYSNERNPGQEDYSAADTMLQIISSHNIAIRGHNIFWDDPKWQLYWVNAMSNPSQLSAAVERRQNSVMSRYKGKVIAWDVVNENLHFRFFENRLGNDISAVFYNRAFRADPKTTMFLNEYNTIEEPGDKGSSPSYYVAKVNKIRRFPGNRYGRLGIGLEAHFNGATPNLGYVRSAIDFLASTGLPIWITELDVKEGPNQAYYLEQLLRELHSHPKIQGIVLWPALMATQGCSQMCLTDMNFNNLPAGNVVDKLLREWGYKNYIVNGIADSSGIFETSLFHGDYEVKVNHPELEAHDLESTHKLSVQPIVPQSDDTPTLLIQLP